MRPGFWQVVIIIALVAMFFGGPIGAFIRGIKRRSVPPPPSPRRPDGRRVRASEDVVDAEIVERS